MTKYDKLLGYWAIFVIIISSGNLFFTVLHIEFSLILMLITVVLFLIRYGTKINKNNLLIFIVIALCILLNSALNYSNGIRINDLIIWTVRLIFLVVIQGRISINKFKRCYCNIVVIEAVISLICYVLLNVVGLSRLPMQFSEVGDANGYYLTPYYTVGWFNYPIFERNAGFFWEPGMHQIFLNLAILFLINDIVFGNVDLENRKAKIIELVVLIIATFTTQSTTGYISLAIVLISVLFIKGEKRVSWKIKMIALIALIIFIAVESMFHIISYKLEGGGSYETRMFDMTQGWKLANENWLFGQGILRSNRNYSGSNGLFSIIVSFGYPIVVLYLAAVFLGLKRILNNQTFIALFAIAFYVISLSSESVGTLTLFLSFIFYWKSDTLCTTESGTAYYKQHRC